MGKFSVSDPTRVVLWFTLIVVLTLLILSLDRMKNLEQAMETSSRNEFARMTLQQKLGLRLMPVKPVDRKR